MVELLIQKLCNRATSHDECGFLSKVFLVPKRSGGYRLVIDLSKLNEFLTPVTFQMDTLVKVKAVTERGMFVTSLDPSDAYHHVPIPIPVLSSQGQKVHVSSALLRLNRGATDVYTNNEARKDLVVASSPGTISIPGRSAQSFQVTSASKDMDGSHQ